MPDYVFPVLGDYRITSGFGHRESPGGIGSTNHRGIDIGAAAGRGIVAPIGGQVVFAGPAGGYGNQVQILGADGFKHSFSHLQGFNVREGMRVQAGQLLGQMGSTGTATGPHLHYEVRDSKNNPINPQGILSRGTSILRETAGSLLGDKAAQGIANVLLPGSGFIMDGLGIGIGGGGCGVNPICHLKEWITESGFFQRLALAIVAFIIIAAAFYMMKSNVLGQVTDRMKGSIA